MDKKRAQEIAASPVMANVVYQGDAIYIDGVNDQHDTCTIHPLNNPTQKNEVPCDKLQEL